MASLPSPIICGISSGIRLTSCNGPTWSRSILSPACYAPLIGPDDARTEFFNRGSLNTRGRRNLFTVSAAERPDGINRKSPDAVDISVFRFTLGIPGLDDSELPRILGIFFGGLLILNHAVSISSLAAAQLRSEGVGLVLAAVSISLPFIGEQLNGMKTRQVLEPGEKQIFSLATGLSESQRQNLAWASYNLLRNTSSTAVLVWHSGQVVGARGYWGILDDSGPGTQPLGWLKKRLDSTLDEFLNLKDPLYLSGYADAQGWDIIPRGTASILVQPFPKDPDVDKETFKGFILLISSTPRAYRKKDRNWAAFLAKKLSNVLSQ